jgi:hypothetical protein
MKKNLNIIDSKRTESECDTIYAISFKRDDLKYYLMSVADIPLHLPLESKSLMSFSYLEKLLRK